MNPPNAGVTCSADGHPSSQAVAAGADSTAPRWLGLVVSHRRLFDASQDGWMRPPHHSGFCLGYESFTAEDCSGPNIIPIRIALDVDKLPFRPPRKDIEPAAAGPHSEDKPRVVPWHAPLPLYAVRTIEVASIAQKNQLLAMVDQFSNVSLPSAEVTVKAFKVSSPAARGAAIQETETPSLQLPETLNAVQGAMAMAVWAVPPVEPWIDLLQCALARNGNGEGVAKEVAEKAGKLDAQWLQMPWLPPDRLSFAHGDGGNQERLWRAALQCMQGIAIENNPPDPDALAALIARTACPEGLNPTVNIWLEWTQQILKGETAITCDDWQQNGAGLAIQLMLLRPDPMTFKSWNRSLLLPPGVWWAAAILCGWYRGYRALDKSFRGDPGQQEFLSFSALQSSSDTSSLMLPPSQQSSLERVHENGSYVLTWCERLVIRKPWKFRAKWYHADLNNVAGNRAAQDLAGRLRWPCIKQQINLPKGHYKIIGKRSLSIDDKAAEEVELIDGLLKTSHATSKDLDRTTLGDLTVKELRKRCKEQDITLSSKRRKKRKNELIDDLLKVNKATTKDSDRASPTEASHLLYLDVKREVSLRLPPGASVTVEKQLDINDFRHRLTTEPGDIKTDPPKASGKDSDSAARPEAQMEKAVATQETGIIPGLQKESCYKQVSTIPGLMYQPEFITKSEEEKLLNCINEAKWSTELRRRVQHYGWRYDYKKRQIDESMHLGPLPHWAQALAQKLVNEKLIKDLPDQMIVNEYCCNQGIAAHIDAEGSFAEYVATISLLETWGMVFRHHDSEKKVEVPLERRSVAILSGDARYKWTHEIPKRDSEPVVGQDGKYKPEKKKRGRRISLTFRKTRLERSA